MDLEEHVGVEEVKERCESCGAKLTDAEIEAALEGASDVFPVRALRFRAGRRRGRGRGALERRRAARYVPAGRRDAQSRLRGVRLRRYEDGARASPPGRHRRGAHGPPGHRQRRSTTGTRASWPTSPSWTDVFEDLVVEPAEIEQQRRAHHGRLPHDRPRQGQRRRDRGAGSSTSGRSATAWRRGSRSSATTKAQARRSSVEVASRLQPGDVERQGSPRSSGTCRRSLPEQTVYHGHDGVRELWRTWRTPSTRFRSWSRRSSTRATGS